MKWCIDGGHMDMAHGQWMEHDTHTDIWARCRRGGNCQESFDTSLGGPQGLFFISETGPQSQHHSRILASTPKGQNSKIPFNKEGNSLVPSSSGVLGPVRASRNPGWLGYQV